MNIVKARLRKPTRVFTFLCGEIPLRRGEACIVKSDRGQEYATCILSPEPCPSGAERRYKMSVLRKLTDADSETFDMILRDEARARDLCASKMRARKLAMKLVDVEYTFDRNKVVFYFTADQRVDFRDLVRDLAHELKARIELRHIQVRDEAKLVGGIGLCGRELCCATWLREFMPISMKMAKRQNLSLNPTKISGQCGRLLCCLSYENDQYQSGKKAKAVAEDRAEEALSDVGPEFSPLSVGFDEGPDYEEKEVRAFEAFTELGAGIAELEEEEGRRLSSVVDINASVAEIVVLDDVEDGEAEAAVTATHASDPSSQADSSQERSGHKRRRRRKRRPSSGKDGAPS